MDRLWERKILFSLAVLFLLISAVPSLPAAAEETVVAGDSYLIVLQKRGKPDNQVKSGRNELLFYGSSLIELMDDGVVRIDGRPAPQAGAGAEQDRQGAGNAAPPGSTTAQRIIDVRQQGRAVDLRPLLVAGGVTVVAFYADW